MLQLKPYLVFEDVVTQIWINQYSIAIVLIAVKLLSFISSLNHSLEAVLQTYTGKKTCQYIDYIIYDSPKELSQAANYLIKKTLQSSLKVTFYFFADLLLIIFNILFFLLDLWLGTYACLFLTAVDTSVDVAINATESVINVANETLHAAAKDLNIGLNGLSEVINNFEEIFNKVDDKIKEIFNADDQQNDYKNIQNNVNHINLTISSLSNFYINSDINSKLNKLADDVPTFEELKNEARSWLETPFNFVSNEMKNQNFSELVTPKNDSIALKLCQVLIPSNLTASNVTSLKAVFKNSLNTETWCMSTLTPEIKNIFSHLVAGLNKFSLAIIVVLISMFIFSLLHEFYKEFLFWNKINKLNKAVREKLKNESLLVDEKNQIEDQSILLSYTSRRCFSNTFEEEDKYKDSCSIRGLNSDSETTSFDITDLYLTTFQEWQLTMMAKIPFAKKFITNRVDMNWGQTANIRSSWFIKYVFSRKSSVLFLVSMCGSIVCLIQYMIICKLKQLVNADHKDGLNSLDFNRNAEMKQKLQLLFNGVKSSFTTWQTNTNTYIENVESRANNEIVIKKIEYISNEVNNTASKIYDSISSTINNTFFGTVFEKPLLGIMNCIIGNKLKSITEGAAWIKQEFQITLPRISEADVNEIFQSLSSFSNSTNLNISAFDTSKNYSSNQLALSSMSKVKLEVDSLKSDMADDLRKLFSYYAAAIKTEFCIMAGLFALWCLQIPVAFLILRFRYKCM